MTMRNLIVIGDSFAFPHPTSQFDLWPVQVGKHFQVSSILNTSMEGCCQDWQLDMFDKQIKSGNLTKDDQLIIVLTSEHRFWYFENAPYLSNLFHYRYEAWRKFVPDRSVWDAGQNFANKVWRNEQASRLQRHRLGEIGYRCLELGLRKPIIIPAFTNSINAQEWPHVNIAYGCLTEDVQALELKKTFNVTEVMRDLWKGMECRFNHLCKINHEILAKSVIESIEKDSQLDLVNTGFHKEIITIDNYNDLKFANENLCMVDFNTMLTGSTRAGSWT